MVNCSTSHLHGESTTVGSISKCICVIDLLQVSWCSDGECHEHGRVCLCIVPDDDSTERSLECASSLSFRLYECRFPDSALMVYKP